MKHSHIHHICESSRRLRTLTSEACFVLCIYELMTKDFILPSFPKVRCFRFFTYSIKIDILYV
ncbi:unnamed protein product [Brassica napus]|uniref:(rape) hypothetical protein n=1 Tax=Brassica napus TaxID=3708 RepID=A0A816LBA6_BRANA|nr:unnamed protein product [Brassica napus]